MTKNISFKILKGFFKTNVSFQLVIYIFIADLIRSQPIPIDFNEYDLFELSFDHGNNWNYLSTFQLSNWNTLNIITGDTYNNDSIENKISKKVFESFIFKPINHSNDSLFVDIKFGSIIQQELDINHKDYQLSNAATLFSYSRYSYGKYLRAWLYPRITSNKNKLLHYTGLPRKQKRAGFNSGEVDMSGIGFFGENVKFWIERGRQNWGAGISNNLALSNNSAAYDQSVFQLDFRKLRYRYFHGFLETIEGNINRFITGKGLEYFNNKNFLIGFHEVSIYSGENRTIDFSYLNPVSTHLEIELNERDNHYGGTGGQNAIWQMSMDYMPLKKLRLSSNILIDELALDYLPSDTLTSRNDYAVKTRLSYSFSLDRYFITAYTDYTYVSENTFRHESGSNNFVSRSLPLGTDLGSDGYIIFFGIKMVLPWKYVADLNFGLKRNGENNLLHNLYDSNVINDLNNNEFSKKNKFTSLDIKYILTKNTNLRFGVKAFNYFAEDKIQYHYYCLVNSSLSTLIKF